MTRGSLAFVTTLIALGVTGPAVAQSNSNKVVLITEAEAKLPALSDVSLNTRAGVTRGPKVMLVSPSAKTGVKSPIHLQVKFKTFGGAEIDPSSVKVTYLKNPAVDLTPRIGPITKASGIDLTTAEVPAGVHHIRVNVKDSDGRAGSASFALKISP
jgi:hypothetical protein